MFAQIIRGKVSDPAAVRPVVERWMRELGPTAKGWLGSTSGVTDHNELFLLARFESEEAAKANSDKPEQGEWWAQLEKLFDGLPSIQDSTNVFVDGRGDFDSAGFVQVMSGQTSNPERTKQLMTDTQAERTALRADILGQVAVEHQDGEFTMAIYFDSEEAAHEGERKEIPPQLQATMQEMMSLGVGQPEFLDLKTVWLDSPKYLPTAGQIHLT